MKNIAPAAYRGLIRARLKKAFKGSFEMSTVPGIHGTFFSSTNIGELARAVKKNVNPDLTSCG